MRGIVYTLEVIFASVIVIAALAFLFRFSQPPAQFDVQLMKTQGMDALQYMDNSYSLRKWVQEGDILQIIDTLNNILPSNINYQAAICQQVCTPTSVPTTKSVVTVDYYVWSYRDQYLGYKVRLWLWR